MIYVYRPTVSDGAREIVDFLNDLGFPARFSQGKLIRERFRPERDKLVCWGAPYASHGGLNNQPHMTKFAEASKLIADHVPTVRVSRTQPTVASGRPGWAQENRVYDEQGVRELILRLQAHLDAPLAPAQIWLARRNNHIGGNDLLRPGGVADFYSLKEPVAHEYRLHIFNGRSIRAGRKIPREAFDGTPHQWVRSFDGGWRIDYSGFHSTRDMRTLAAAAVGSLGLDFGAVDLAERPDGTLFVLEVNRAPGAEGGTAERYAQAIGQWAAGVVERREED